MDDLPTEEKLHHTSPYSGEALIISSCSLKISYCTHLYMFNASEMRSQ